MISYYHFVKEKCDICGKEFDGKATEEKEFDKNELKLQRFSFHIEPSMDRTKVIGVCSNKCFRKWIADIMLQVEDIFDKTEAL